MVAGICMVLLVMMMRAATTLYMAASAADPKCMNRCGSTAVMYPLGTGTGCGSPEMQRYVKCSKGEMKLYTSTGQYEVVEADYGNQVIIVTDPAMSTCSDVKRTRSGFGIQGGSPFKVHGANILLIGCSSSSSGSSSSVDTSGNSKTCDPVGAQTCSFFYKSCPAIANLGLSSSSKSAAATCCLYKPPSDGEGQGVGFGISPGDLGCAAYTSVYSFSAGGATYGQDFPPPGAPYTRANTWSYGIPLHYTLQLPAPAACPACQQSNGSCATSADSSFLCVCPSGIHTADTCPASSQVPKSPATSLHDTKRGLLFSSIFVILIGRLHIKVSL